MDKVEPINDRKGEDLEKDISVQHHDGIQVVQNIDPEIEKRVVKKTDWNLLPLVSALYLLAFLDRSNIGNARIAGMEKDLHLTGNHYTWLLTIFYISYITFEWQSLIWKILPPHIWGAFCVFGWGLISTTLAGVHSWRGAMALRFLMGVFEAGYGPSIPFLMSFFYKRHEIGLRCGLFLSAAPLASTFSGALAYGITSGHAKIAKWRLLFLVEGIPTLCMVPVVFFFLPDSAGTARFLNEEERAVAEARSVQQAGTGKRMGTINWKDVLMTFTDVKAWVVALIYFSCNVSFASLPVFLPTILSQMGFTAINAQGLTAPPFFLSFLLTIATTWIADRTQQRTLMVAGLTVIGGAGYLMLAIGKSVGVRYTGVFLAAAGIFPAIANTLALTLNQQGSDTRRGVGIALLNIVGQCGPLLGTNLFPTNEKPYYVKGMSVCAAFMFFATVLVLVLRTILSWENRKLDQKYGTLEEQRARMTTAITEDEARKMEIGVENFGPMYRFDL